MYEPLAKNDTAFSRKVVISTQPAASRGLGCEENRPDYPGSLMGTQHRDKSSSCLALHHSQGTATKKFHSVFFHFGL